MVVQELFVICFLFTALLYCSPLFFASRDSKDRPEFWGIRIRGNSGNSGEFGGHHTQFSPLPCFQSGVWLRMIHPTAFARTPIDRSPSPVCRSVRTDAPPLPLFQGYQGYTCPATILRLLPPRDKKLRMELPEFSTYHILTLRIFDQSLLYNFLVCVPFSSERSGRG